MVLASNTEAVLLPVNEPTFGTKRKSQIQTYLEQNGGPGASLFFWVDELCFWGYLLDIACHPHHTQHPPRTNRTSA